MTVTERLAIELHRQYRAAEKSFRYGSDVQHDHGWAHCQSRRYFQRRALLIIKRAKCTNPSTLGEAEQNLASLVLLRRLVVGL